MKAVVHTNTAACAKESTTEWKRNSGFEKLGLCRLLGGSRLDKVHLLQSIFTGETMLVCQVLHRIANTSENSRVEGTLGRVVKVEAKRHSCL